MDVFGLKQPVLLNGAAAAIGRARVGLRSPTTPSANEMMPGIVASSDGDLRAQAVSGDEDALSELLVEYGPQVCAALSNR